MFLSPPWPVTGGSTIGRQSAAPGPAEDLDEALRSVLAVEAAHGEAQRAARADGVEAHRREHVRGLAGVVGAAGAARRDRDAGVVEREQQADGVGLLAREAQAEVAGQPQVRVADEVGVADLLAQRVEHTIAEPHETGRLLGHLDPGEQSCLAEADDARHVLGRRAQAALLAAAVG